MGVFIRRVEMKTRRLIRASVFMAIMTLLFSSCSGGGSDTTPQIPFIAGINGGPSAIASPGGILLIQGGCLGSPTSTSSGYFVSFRDSATNNIIENAVVDVSTAGNWTDALIKAVAPNQLTIGTTYKVTVTTPGGTSNALKLLIVGRGSFSPSTILWSPSYPLPVAQQGFSTVVGVAGIGTTAYIYCVGGNTAMSGTADGDRSNVDTVYMNQINGGDGSLSSTSWSTLTSLPAERGFAAAVLADSDNSLVNGSAIYVLGGLDDTGAATNTVYDALPNSDGTIPASGSPGSWTATTALPQPLSALQAVIFCGRIYVAGGNGSTGAPVANVYSAKINADGTLDNWSTLTDLPAALAFHQLVEISGTLYVLGGDTAAVDPISDSPSASAQDSVYYNPINIETGTIGPCWTENRNKMTKAREKFSALAAGGYVLVSGGLFGRNPGSSEESYASVNSDGSLSSFIGAVGSPAIVTSSHESFYNHSWACVIDSSGNPHILLLGGAEASTGELCPGVWYQR